MTEIDAIRGQHAGEHITQPCKVAQFPCDISTLLTEIDRLRAIEAAAQALMSDNDVWLGLHDVCADSDCRVVGLRNALGDAS